MQPPPVRVNILEKTAFGVPLRAVAFLAASGAVALAVLLGLPSLSLTLRGAGAVLLVGLGLALAFGEIDGQKPEAWLLGLLSFRRRVRYLIKGARLQPDALRVTLGTTPESVPAAEPALTGQDRALSPSATGVRPALGFFILTGGAVSASVLAGLTLYLLTGGAARLLALLHSL